MHRLLLLLLTILYCGQVLHSHAQTTYLFVGSYTDNQPAKGIYIFSFNTRNGRWQPLSTGENLVNPSYLSLAPNGRYLYACTDTRLPNHGSVTAFAIDSTRGTLQLLNKQATHGDNPAYVSVSSNGGYVITGNYSGGSASVFTTNADGSLNPATQVLHFQDSSINKARQEKAHIHAAVFSPDSNYLYLPDLGADKIRAFRFAPGQPQPLLPADDYTVRTTPGSGPRHFTFHPNGRFAYSIEELSGTVSVYAYDQGKLDTLQRLRSYAQPRETYSGADIHVSPDGKFLYTSNRLENTIAIFAIDQEKGTLTLVGHQNTGGDHPRNFNLDPSGRYLLVANMLTNDIIIFKRHRKTGLLKKTGNPIKVPSPSCVQFGASVTRLFSN